MGGKSDIVEQALKLIAGTGPELTSNGIRAYHGSPHLIDRFEWSPRTRGTGEGAQSYGDGLYFAGKEDIAQWYRDKLALSNLRNRFLDHLPQDAEFGDVDALIGSGAFTPDQERFLTALRDNDWLGYDYPAQAISAATKRLNDYDPTPELVEAAGKLGNMYEVNLAADPNRLLDWNDPLNAQPADVRQAIMPFAEQRADRMNKARREMLDRGVDMMGRPFKPERLKTLESVADPETFTGENIYRQIQAHLGAASHSDKAAEASQFLTDQGLHGIQYLDASSRAPGLIEPTKNFVIPDDKRVSIIRRYEEGGAVDGDEEHNDYADGGAVERKGYAGRGRVVEDALKFARESIEALSKDRGKTPGELLSGFANQKPRLPYEEWRFDYTPSANLLDPKEFNPEAFKPGDVLIPLIGDRTSTGRKITSIGGQELSFPTVTEGGPDYMRGPSQVQDQNAWASGKGVVTKLNNRMDKALAASREAGYKDPSAYGVYVAMGPKSGDFSAHTTEAVMGMLPGSKITKKSAKEFDAAMKKQFADWPGILSPNAADYVVNAGAGVHRKAVLDAMDTAYWRDKGFPDVSLARYATTTPELIGAPDEAAGYAIAKMNPNAPVGGITAPHRTYEQPMPGEYVGRLPEGVSRDDVFTQHSARFDANPPSNNYVMAKRRSFERNQDAFQIMHEPDIERMIGFVNKLKSGYADGGSVDDQDADIEDALRIAKADAGAVTGVMMEDAKGNQYDAQGNIIPRPVASSEAQPQRPHFYNQGPENYATEVQPFMDRASDAMAQAGRDDSAALSDVLRRATRIAAQGQPEGDSRGEYNWSRQREDLINSLYGANPDEPNSPAANQAYVVNRMADFSPVALPEIIHDTIYEAGRTGDYNSALIDGALNAAFTAPVLGALGRGVKKGYQWVKQHPKAVAGLAGGLSYLGSDADAEAGGKSKLAGEAIGALKSIFKLPEVRASTDNLHDVGAANFDHYVFGGHKTLPIDRVYGGVDLSMPDQRARVDALKAAISDPQNGYISRLIVDDEGNAIEGQHRLDALRELGATEVPVSVLRDRSRGIDTAAIKQAMQSQGGLHSDHANQIVDMLLDGDPNDWEPPQGFEKFWNAGLQEYNRQRGLTSKNNGGSVTGLKTYDSNNQAVQRALALTRN